MAGSKRIGGIRFGVSMDTAGIKKGAKKGETAIQGFTRRIKGFSATTVKSFGVMGTAAAGAFGVMVKSQFSAVDSLAKTADKIGATTEALAGMRHAAELTGVQSNTLDMALQRMTRRLSEAGRGTGEAKDAIAELGLNAKTLAGLSVDQQFSRVADAMNKVANQGDRVRLGFKIFDSEGVALVNTLKLGSKGLFEAAREADRLGLSISRVDAAKIEAANDAVTRMKSAFAGVARTVAVKFAPTIESMAQSIERLVAPTEKFKNLLSGGNAANGFLGTVLDIAKLVKDAFLGLRALVTKVLSFVVNDIDKFAKRIAGLVDKLEGLPGIGDKAKAVASSLRSGTLDNFNKNLKRQSAMANDAFMTSFTAKTPSERLARRAAAPVAVAKATQAGSTFPFEKLEAAFKSGLEKARGIGAQAVQGAQQLSGMARQAALGGLQLQEAGLRAQLAASQEKRVNPVLSFSQKGSVGAFRARADQKRFNEANKLRREQRELLKKIAENTEQQQLVAADL